MFCDHEFYAKYVRSAVKYKKQERVFPRCLSAVRATLTITNSHRRFLSYPQTVIEEHYLQTHSTKNVPAIHLAFIIGHIYEKVFKNLQKSNMFYARAEDLTRNRKIAHNCNIVKEAIEKCNQLISNSLNSDTAVNQAIACFVELKSNANDAVPGSGSPNQSLDD
ncbi:hypothetical protein RF11_07958 [Thelohanellus kitauei]|uniref:Uncharacterized protein n=1 Tax=Thelohanellus kitauei TaxID=669202 RepID=A0A0C2N3C7_THEKT|nr:hypothetical protein RF11_07958 [Thelohanellus kitauei]